MNRLDMLRQALPESADAFLVTTEVNIRYLTGFDYTDGYLLITRSSAWCFADSRYIEAAKNQVGDEFEKVLLNKGKKELLPPRLDDVKLMLYEDGGMTARDYQNLKNDLPEIELQAEAGLLSRLRRCKDDGEADCIIRAQRIAEDAFDHVLGYISPERTEKDVALELEFYMRSHGAEASAFDVIAASGHASSMPHAVPRDCKLEKGFLTMDFGAKVNGYCSDMTRTVCIGKADDEMKKVYATVLKAQLAALEAIHTGASCRWVDGIARNIIAEAGYGEAFGHSLGHGVGLYIHEAPNLSPGAGNNLLARGDIVTVEPGIYLEGRFGVRIEDMVYMSADGPVDLTKAPKELLEL